MISHRRFVQNYYTCEQSINRQKNGIEKYWYHDSTPNEKKKVLWFRIQSPILTFSYLNRSWSLPSTLLPLSCRFLVDEKVMTCRGRYNFNVVQNYNTSSFSHSFQALNKKFRRYLQLPSSENAEALTTNFSKNRLFRNRLSISALMLSDSTWGLRTLAFFHALLLFIVIFMFISMCSGNNSVFVSFSDGA